MLHSKEQIGRLDYRITFQEKVIGVNESNEDEETGWDDIAISPTVWASKTEKTTASGEQYRADKLTAYQNTIFVCRYRSDITTMNRVICRGVKYNILSIQELGRKRYMSIETESGGEYVENDSASFAASAFSNAFNV